MRDIDRFLDLERVRDLEGEGMNTLSDESDLFSERCLEWCDNSDSLSNSSEKRSNSDNLSGLIVCTDGGFHVVSLSLLLLLLNLPLAGGEPEVDLDNGLTGEILSCREVGDLVFSILLFSPSSDDISTSRKSRASIRFISTSEGVRDLVVLDRLSVTRLLLLSPLVCLRVSPFLFRSSKNSFRADLKSSGTNPSTNLSI